MPPDPRVVTEVMTLAIRLDREWIRKVPETDRRRAPWMPFPVPAFLALLLEAVPEAPGSRFLDIGCGPGSKMLLAREICGLDVTGIEIEPQAAAEAGVVPVDAADFTDYGKYDLIWFNRVYRDPGLQAVLEARIWAGMAPGAVVMCANLEAPPPSSWLIVLDDWEARRGIWRKPGLLSGYHDLIRRGILQRGQ